MKKIALILIALLLVPLSARAINLEACVHLALQKNPAVGAARENLTAAGSRLNQARAALLPHISLNASYGKSYSQSPTLDLSKIPGLASMDGFSLYPDEAADVKSYSFNLRQPLFSVALPGLVMMANSSYRAYQQELLQAQNEVTYNVVSAYYSVLKAEKGWQIAKDTIASLKKYSQQANILYDEGVISRADVLRFQSALAGARLAEIQTRSGVEIARLALNSLLGDDLEKSEQLEDLNVFSAAEPPSFEALLKTAYKSRPEWMAFKMSENIADANVNIAVSNYLPNLTLIGSIGKNYSSYPSLNINYELNNWTLLASASWNIFDSFENYNKITEASANRRALTNQEQAVRDGVALDVKTAYLDLLSKVEQLSAAEISCDLSKKAMDLIEINYTSNISPQLSLLDARNNFNQAQVALWNARYDLQIARAKLNKSVGLNLFPL